MPIYDVKAVGKTGAGDAFASAFLSAIILKKDIQTAMQWGTANSASVIQQIGAQKGLLNKVGIEKMVRRFKNIKPTTSFSS
jgi:sugar/nucleoside kinase (ribokinase family)